MYCKDVRLTPGSLHHQQPHSSWYSASKALAVCVTLSHNVPDDQYKVLPNTIPAHISRYWFG